MASKRWHLSIALAHVCTHSLKHPTIKPNNSKKSLHERLKYSLTRPEFTTENSCNKAGWNNIVVIPELGRWSQMDTWPMICQA